MLLEKPVAQTGVPAIVGAQSDESMLTTPPSSQSYWLALGVFYEPGPLRNVLAELSDAGFGVERFCIVRKSLAGRWTDGHAPLPRPDFERLFSDVRNVAGLHHDGTYALSTGALLDAFLATAHREADGRLRCPAWMSRAQCAQLMEHLGGGAAALIVRSESAPEQNTSSRTLLRHARNIVWTYDFSRSFAAPPAQDGA